jgi:anti-sigma regulatory factor (Ser/Thr protein kinase)
MSDERLTICVPARPEAVGQLRRRVVAHAETVGASGAARDAVALAVSEALTNVVVHAYAADEPGNIIVEAWPDQDGHFLVMVCDEGRGMLPRTDSPGLGWG